MILKSQKTDWQFLKNWKKEKFQQRQGPEEDACPEAPEGRCCLPALRQRSGRHGAGCHPGYSARAAPSGRGYRNLRVADERRHV